jgi:SAM-dependent methyltransferase
LTVDDRDSALRMAWSRDDRGRIDILRELCRGLDVLDLGCVDHSPGEISGEEWLHRTLAEVARSCVGVDFEPSGVAAMNASGFVAVCADITGDTTALAAHLPVDVVVAGEILEHLSSLGALMTFAREALRPGGVLVCTTPNPYAPHRFRAGVRRNTWENVDHVVYLFPSGVAELAARAGLRLRNALVVNTPPSGGSALSSLKEFAAAAGAAVVGRRGAPRDGVRRWLGLRTDYVTPLDWLQAGVRNPMPWFGETAIYIIEQPDER